MNIIFAGFVIKFLIVLSQFFVELPFTQTDPAAFHNEAVKFKGYLENLSMLNSDGFQYKPGWIYSLFLGFVYFVFGDTVILGGFLSCFVWLLSAIVFKNILTKLNLNKEKITLALFVYTFLFPISFYYTLLMLREVYLLLFINLIILAFINIEIHKNLYARLKYVPILIIFVVLLILFHKAYITIFLIYTPIFFIFFFIEKFNFKFVKSYFYLIIIISLPILHYSGIFEKSFYKIIDYQTGHFTSSWVFRADFLYKKDVENLDYSFIGFIYRVTINLFNYFFQPTIFRVTELKDIILFFENSLRVLFLVIIAIKTLKKYKKDYIYFMLLLMFIIMEFVYAQATVNWGTASRHHIPVIGLMILLLFYPNNNKSND